MPRNSPRPTVKATVHCSLCGDRVTPDKWVQHRDIENFVLVEIRRLNPQWIEDDGASAGTGKGAVTRAWRSVTGAQAA